MATARQVIAYTHHAVRRIGGRWTPVGGVADMLHALPYDDMSAVIWCLTPQDMTDVLTMALREYAYTEQSGSVPAQGQVSALVTQDRVCLSVKVRYMQRYSCTWLNASMYDTTLSSDDDACDDFMQTCLDLDISAITPASSAMRMICPMSHRERFAADYPRYDVELDSRLQASARGGLVWAGCKGLLHDVVDVDVNSMYPSIALNDKLPYGNPVDDNGIVPLDNRYWTISECLVSATIKDDGIPAISYSPSGRRREERLVESTHGYVPMTLTQEDYSLLMSQYDTDVIVEQTWGWKVRRAYFGPSMRQLGLLKERCANTVARSVLKKLLNAGIGKFAAHEPSERINAVPSLDMQGHLRYQPATRHVEYEQGVNSHHYIPLAAAIWSKARKRLVDDMMAVRNAGGRVPYCNTDGFMIQGMDIDTIRGVLDVGSRIGQYKIQAQYDEVYIREANLYMGQCADGSREWAHSGVADVTMPSWGDFVSGTFLRSRP